MEIAAADHPGIRFFTVPKKTSITPLCNTEESDWIICSPSTVSSFSAVAYFFARELSLQKKVAVGVISSSWGATSAEAWISSDVLATHHDFREQILKTDTDTSGWNSYVRNSIRVEQEREIVASTSVKGIEEGATETSYDDTGWKKCLFPLEMKRMGLNGYWGLVWLRKHFDLPDESAPHNMKLVTEIQARGATIFLNGKEAARLVNPAGPVEVKIDSRLLQRGHNVLSVRLYVHWGSAHIGSEGGDTYLIREDVGVRIPLEGEWRFNKEIEPAVAQWQDYYNRPSVLYNARIAPIIPYGIKGVIWYQGENNAGRGYQYRSLFPLLIEDWRVRWGVGYFPFLYVQLANYMEKKTEPSESDWAELREAQLMTLKYPNTGMAVTIDIGDPADIHPRNKKDVGKRLFLQARKVAYGEDIVASGPLYDSFSVEGNRIRINFVPASGGLRSADGKELKGFSVAGSDSLFCWADAVIEGNSVIVSSPQVTAPLAVRYSWENNPDGNLTNSDGLPASPFRTDNWKRVTEQN
jgi:sialate O-acetylesterase